MGLSWQQGPPGRDPNGRFLADRNLSIDEAGALRTVAT